MKSQFTIRTVLVGVTLLSVYLALASRYGFGRAIVCTVTILQGVSSILFFLAAYHSHKSEHPRNALAATILGTLILVGSLLLATIVFQPTKPPIESLEGGVNIDNPPTSHFDLE